MSTEEPAIAPIKLSELIGAFEFVSFSGLYEHGAYICKSTGVITYVSDGVDLEEETELPDDFDESDYLPVPDRRDLDLGQRLALSFVAQELPGSLEKTRGIFSRKGAYGRFKQLLWETGTLDKWYAFEAQASETTLKEWCAAVGLTLMNDEQRA